MDPTRAQHLGVTSRITRELIFAQSKHTEEKSIVIGTAFDSLVIMRGGALSVATRPSVRLVSFS